jgi:hypothetical protein
VDSRRPPLPLSSPYLTVLLRTAQTIGSSLSTSDHAVDYTHTYTRTHTRTHTHTHTHIHIHIHTHNAYMHTHTYTRTHTHTHTHTYHMTCTHKLTCTDTHMHIQRHAHTHACTRNIQRTTRNKQCTARNTICTQATPSSSIGGRASKYHLYQLIAHLIGNALCSRVIDDRWDHRTHKLEILGP